VYVKAFMRPFSSWHDRYQAYYHEGLRLYCERVGGHFEAISLSHFPRLSGHLRNFRDSGYLGGVIGRRTKSIIDRAGSALERSQSPPAGIFKDIVGQYLVVENGSERRFCIDSADSSALMSPELAQWSDIYFKTNFWPSVFYGPKVKPLVNGDPLVLRFMPTLRSFRRVAKEYAISFIVRVWGGRDGIEGIEHILRLLDAVNRVRCRRFVLAVLVSGDIERESRYLTSLGVPWTRKAVSSQTLWHLTAQSELNIVRLGMHQCIPWRVTGSLAMGSCLVLDQPPRSKWPQPLLEHTHFLSLDAPTAPGEPVASDRYYAEIPEKIEAWLSDDALTANIRRNNEEYFDRFLEPGRVGGHIVKEATAVHRGRSPVAQSLP
jgi:hypothetical protein